jgi:redox-sensitive bicupin YhaK (pirin superfamily)
VLTRRWQQRLDPFLMLDHFVSDNPADYIAGFPDHPHRGFETITLMLQGRMRHRDSAGHEGLIHDGGVQWMTAARGIIHSETPEQTQGRMDGFQLWLNLHSSDKMGPVGYQDIQDTQIPRWIGEGVFARVVAGRCHGMQGAMQRTKTCPIIIDLQLQPHAVFEQDIAASMNAFCYVHSGSICIQSQRASARHMAVLSTQSDQDGVMLQAGVEPTRVLLVAGQPLGEPIAQHGPFVMNTQAELMQAVHDYQSGQL